MNLVKFFMLSALVVGLLACATPPSTVLSIDEQTEISSLRVVSFVSEHLQPQWYNYDPEPIYGQYGAISTGLLSIGKDKKNSNRQERAESTIVPYRAVLHDQNAAAGLQQSLSSVVKNVPWAKVTQVITDLPQRNFVTADYMASIDEDALLVLKSEYSMTPNLESLEIHTTASLYKKSALQTKTSSDRNETTHKIKPFFEKNLVYQSRFYSSKYNFEKIAALNEEIKAIKSEYAPQIKKAKSFEKKTKLAKIRNVKVRRLKIKREKQYAEFFENNYVGFWNKNNGEKLKAAFKIGLSEQARLLRFALQSSLPSTIPGEDKISMLPLRIDTSFKTKLLSVNGVLINEENGRTIIQVGNARLYSYDQREFPRLVILTQTSAF